VVEILLLFCFLASPPSQQLGESRWFAVDADSLPTIQAWLDDARLKEVGIGHSYIQSNPPHVLPDTYYDAGPCDLPDDAFTHAP